MWKLVWQIHTWYNNLFTSYINSFANWNILGIGSAASLGMGLAFGGVLGFGAYQTSVNPNNYYLGLGTSAVLAGVMGHRFMNSGKFMPAGLVATLSIAMVIRYAARSYLTVKEE